MTYNDSYQPGRRYRLSGDVFEAALDRIRWLYDEFDNQVCVSSSGGKDSTVCIELALIVAEERNALPLKVWWLDQEAENQATVDFQQAKFDDPRIDFDWYQIPFRLSNSLIPDGWLYCWHPDEEWVRPRHPDAITVNDFGTDRFHPLLHAINDRYGGATIGGVRIQESPTRRRGLTGGKTYKWVTWGRANTASYTFYPIFDWKTSDVWHAITDNDWEYCRSYDLKYQYGINPEKMRVSALIHEQSLTNLFFLHETEPEMYAALTRRVPGVSMASHLDDEYYTGHLPYMFDDWPEYFEYLADNLLPEESASTIKQQYATHLAQLRRKTQGKLLSEFEVKLAKAASNAVVANDLDDIKMKNIIASVGMVRS